MTRLRDPVDELPARSLTPDGRPSRWQRVPKATAAVITSVVALIAAFIGLGFDLWPTLRPDPRTDVGADLTIVAVERNVTLRDWMRRSSGSPEEYRRRRAEYVREAEGVGAMAFPGELAYVEVSVRGFKRRGVILNWAVYNARASERTTVESSMEQGQHTSVGLDAPKDEFVAELWIEPVFGRRLYFVRAEAREPDGTLLAIADSKPFRGLPFPE